MKINLKFDNILRNLQETSEKIFTFGKGSDTVSNVIQLLFGTGNASLISNNGVMQYKDQGEDAVNFKDIATSSAGTNQSSYIINKDNATADAESSQIEFEVGTGTNAIIKYDHTDHTIGINKSFKMDDIVLAVDNDDDITIAGDKIMTAGNDGTGSGFDADTVDGMDADDFAPSSHVGDDGDAHAGVTQSVDGFMLSEDKVKLDKIFIYDDVSAVANAIEIVPSPAVDSYVAGFTAFIKVANSTTGEVTIKFNNLATKALKKFTYYVMETGDLHANQIILIQYDGTVFHLLSSVNSKPIYSTLIDAKGDIIAGSSNDVAIRVPVGTDDYILTADSTASSGVAWKAMNVLSFQMKVIPDSGLLTTGDGKGYFIVPPTCNGLSLVAISFDLVTACSTSGLPTFQLHNLTTGHDMLSTEVTIDENEFSSNYATTAGVINATYKIVSTSDRLRIDCDVAGTGSAGLVVYLKFQ